MMKIPIHVAENLWEVQKYDVVWEMEGLTASIVFLLSLLESCDVQRGTDEFLVNEGS